MNRALALLAPAVAVLLLAGCSPTKETCISPSFMCNGKCLDGSRDPNNCGGCGVTCTASQTCCGSCVDLQTSTYNCGACGTRCAVEAVCTAGACGCPAARPDPCGSAPGFPGACVNLQTGLGGYCGACGVVCQGTGVAGTDATCTAGACVCADTPAATDCSSTSPAIVCVNTLVDRTNCGGCGIDCAPHATCASNGAPSPTGVCGCSDPAFPDSCGTTLPGGAGCVNFAADPANCGACGHACTGSTPACSNGHCCPSGQGFCSGACINVRTDVNNCGSCGHACGAGQVCTNGSCVCSTGQFACGVAGCCAGGCCGSGGSETCMTAHNNGLGQLFFDCTPSYTPETTTQATASAAATAWGATSQFDASTLCGGGCWAGQKTGQCAIWCFDPSPFRGRVLAISTSGTGCSALACPTAFTGSSWPSP